MRPCFALIAVLAGCVLLAERALADDQIEFLSGARVQGKVTHIDRTQKIVTFDARIGGREIRREYPYNKIHAVTYNGQRYVLNKKESTPKPLPRSTDQSGPDATSPQPPRSVKALIEEAGKTPPDWYDDTPLEYPPTLDLSWPAKPQGAWNNQKNVGQYMWDIVNPNPDRWRRGVKLVHHLLAMHQNDAKKRQRAMQTLGGMYFNLFQDYARAAYWWQQAGVDANHNAGFALGECYWRLGDRQAAVAFLVDPDRPRPNNSLRVGMIKLWGDMGETDKAVKVAEWYVRVGGEPHMAFLFAGDALRLAGRYQESLNYYQKVINAPDGKNKKNSDREKSRARASLEAVRLFDLSDVSRVADGSYQAESIGYSGPVVVEVVVQSRQIKSVRVVRHVEKQFYAALTDVPDQIIAKQGVKGVDATSRATMTAEAILNATAKALAQGAN